MTFIDFNRPIQPTPWWVIAVGVVAALTLFGLAVVGLMTVIGWCV